MCQQKLSTYHPCGHTLVEHIEGRECEAAETRGSPCPIDHEGEMRRRVTIPTIGYKDKTPPCEICAPPDIRSEVKSPEAQNAKLWQYQLEQMQPPQKKLNPPRPHVVISRLGVYDLPFSLVPAGFAIGAAIWAPESSEPPPQVQGSEGSALDDQGSQGSQDSHGSHASQGSRDSQDWSHIRGGGHGKGRRR